MQFEGAVVREQGVTFGIVIVNENVLRTDYATKEMMEFGTRAFGNMPIILMSQNSRGVPTYKGRSDIVNFLTNVDMRRIPWKRFTI